MKVEYTKRALSDIRQIAAESRAAFGNRVAAALETRIRAVVHQISLHPLSAPEVADRPGRHVVPLRRYPFLIFYRVLNDRIRVLHVRHSARRPWTEAGD